MPTARSYVRSFAGGEVTPEFFGRFDDVKNQTGLQTCRNCIIKPHGPAANRGGLRYVAAAKNATSTTAPRLLPFIYSSDQSVAIEMGAGYFRFHTLGATILSSGAAAWSNTAAYTPGDLVISGGVTYHCILAHTNHAPPNATYWYALPSSYYEIPNPYVAADLAQIKFVQSNDVLTLVHPNYPPAELRRYGASRWVYAAISFVSTLAVPAGIGAVATPATTSPGTPTLQSYVVTAVLGSDESAQSTVASCSNNLFDAGAYNTITWSAVTGAERYYVYKLENGLYGYIGQTLATTFKDDNIAPDMSKSPPILDNPFSGPNNYPQCTAYFEQRRFFGSTLNNPAYFWGTRSGTETNLAHSIPGRDDDSIRVRIAARERCEIRHIVPLTNLVLLAESMEWRVAPTNGDVLTPDVSVRPQSGVGCNHTTPVIVNNNILFAGARGGHLFEIGYNLNAAGYITGDLCLRAPHLFDSYSIIDMAFAKSPVPIVWCVSSSGKLLGLTYVPDEEVGAWHQHDTADGSFKHICAVPENGVDVLYCAVTRSVGGSNKQYIERMEPRQSVDDQTDFFVDCGLTYSGPPATVFSGLSHLNGKVVSILADGGTVPDQTVVGGTITLTTAASLVHIGLPITCDIRTLPAAFNAEAFGQGRPKNVNAVYLRVFSTRDVWAGPSFDKLREYKPRNTEPYDSAPNLTTGEVAISLTPSWTSDGEVCVRHTAPLPFTLISITPEHAIGG